jgi:hypothetical protein
MDEFSIEVKITYEDYAKSMWFKYMRINGRAWPAYLLLGLSNAAMMGYAAYAFLRWGFQGRPLEWITVALMALFIPLFLLIRYVYIRVGFGMRRDRSFTCRYEFSREGIRAERTGGGAPGVREYKLGEIRKVYETGEAFYIDVGEGEFLVVPGRDLDAETAGKVKGILAEK